MHVGDVDDANRGKAGVTGGDVCERHLAAFEDKDPKPAGPVDGQVAEPDIDTVLSNPDIV